MQKNINGKEILNEYIKSMEIVYKDQIELQELFYSDKLLDEYFDINKSLKFTRTWEILMNKNDFLIDYAVRNLILLFNACSNKYKETLEALWGINVEYKNEATLRVMITNARKKIKEIYNEKYGNN